RGHANAETFAETLDQIVFGLVADKIPAQQIVQTGNDEIWAHREIDKQGLQLAILRHQSNSVTDRVNGRVDLDGGTVDLDSPRVLTTSPEDANSTFGPPPPWHPGQPLR